MSGTTRKEQERKIDEMVEESFPASDPPSTTPSTRTGIDAEFAKVFETEEEPEPKGSPTSDRHRMERVGEKIRP